MKLEDTNFGKVRNEDSVHLVATRDDGKTYLALCEVFRAARAKLDIDETVKGWSPDRLCDADPTCPLCLSEVEDMQDARPTAERSKR